LQGIVEPLDIGHNESIYREGLGQVIDSDNINREEAEEFVRKYAISNRMDDLVFSSQLNFDERKELRRMAERYGLSEKVMVQPAPSGRVGHRCQIPQFFLLGFGSAYSLNKSLTRIIFPNADPYQGQNVRKN